MKITIKFQIEMNLDELINLKTETGEVLNGDIAEMRLLSIEKLDNILYKQIDKTYKECKTYLGE